MNLSVVLTHWRMIMILFTSKRDLASRNRERASCSYSKELIKSYLPPTSSASMVFSRVYYLRAGSFSLISTRNRLCIIKRHCTNFVKCCKNLAILSRPSYDSASWLNKSRKEKDFALPTIGRSGCGDIISCSSKISSGRLNSLTDPSFFGRRMFEPRFR